MGPDDLPEDMTVRDAEAFMATTSTPFGVRPPARSACHTVSGIYHGAAHGYRIELLLDCEHARLSADFFRLLGGRSEHLGWCFVRSASVDVDANQVVVKGVGRYSFGAAAPLLELSVARTPAGEPRAPARLRFLNTDLSPGATYLCRYVETTHTDPPDLGRATILPFTRRTDA